MHKEQSLKTYKRPVGEAKIWFSGLGLSVGLIMIFGLLAIILYNGIEAFWPKQITSFSISRDGTTEQVLGSIVQERTRSVKSLDGHVKKIDEIQIYTANKEQTGSNFRFVDVSDIKEQKLPADAMLISRMEGGPAIGYPIALTLEDGKAIDAKQKDFCPTLDQLIKRGKSLREQLLDVEKNQIGSINEKLDSCRLSLKTLQMEKGSDDHHAEKQEIEQKTAELKSQYEALSQEALRLRNELDKNRFSYKLENGQTVEIPAYSIDYYSYSNQLGFWGKCGFFINRCFAFITEDPREANTEGGIFPAIFGTFVMTILMSILVTPLGVIAAIYLKEYARQGILVQFIRICVNNLAGVPSIVFGVFGLGFFVYLVGGTVDSLFFADKLNIDNTPTFGTPGILWASFTLALMTLPVVIVATEESISSVPRGLREAALACGASKWQMIQRIILPGALPGVLTGLILAMARGAGEVAPLMLTGVVKLAPSLPVDMDAPFFHLERKFMHLGFHIYDVGFQSPDSDAAKPMVFAATLLLIALVVFMNLAAIMIRNHLRKKHVTNSF